MKYDVFISYRRDGGDTLSQLIYDRLTHRGYNVFLDIESLNSGKFNEKLLEVIEECKDIIVILPPNGMDRCCNEGDWVFRELEHAIKHKKNIVPVLMKGFEWPDYIPEEIAEIRNYNGIVDNKDYFDAVIEKLTTLLVSKPNVYGNVLKNIKKRAGVVKNKAKKKKKLFFISALLILIGIGTFFGLQYMEKQKRSAREQNVIIRLNPSEKMSASEYYNAIDILKERFDILADGKEYSFEDYQDEIVIKIPQSVFHDIEVKQTLQCYVSRPAEIYLAGNVLEDEDYFHIKREDIEKIELVDDIPGEIDMENYSLKGIDSEEDCQFFALTVKEETVKEAKDWMKTTNLSEVHLFQDCENTELVSHYYYHLSDVFEDGNVLYFLDNFQYSNYLDLILYNYQNETFSNPFYFSIELPVVWQYNDDEEVTFGKNQCNIDEIGEDRVVKYDFTNYSSQMTDGEWKHIDSIFKTRMDALNIPYALGYKKVDENIITVAVDAVSIDPLFLDAMGEYGKINIKSRFYELLDEYYIEKISIEETEENSYQLVVVPNENWNSYAKTQGVDLISQNETIYLCLNNYPNIKLDESTLEEAFDGKKFVFDSVSILGIDSVGEKEKIIFEFLKALQETEIPSSYNCKETWTKMDESELENLIPVSLLQEETKTYFEEFITEAALGNSVTVDAAAFGQDVEIEIECPEGENYTEYAHKAFKELYEQCALSPGKTTSLELYYYGESNQYINFQVIDSEYAHGVEFKSYYSFGDNETLEDEFDKIFNEDEFYKQFIIDDIYQKEGYVSFKY